MFTKQLAEQASSFHAEVALLREEFVSSPQFVALETRVEKLEAGGLPSSQISGLQSQLGRLDSANKQLSFEGFEEMDDEKCCQRIERLLETIGL